MASTFRPNPIAGSMAVSICFEVNESGYGKCIGFSDGAVDLLGFSQEEMIGEDVIAQILDPADLPFEQSRARRAWDGGVASVSSRLGEFQRKNLMTKDRRLIPCAVCGELATCLSPDTGEMTFAHVSTWVPM